MIVADPDDVTHIFAPLEGSEDEPIARIEFLAELPCNCIDYQLCPSCFWRNFIRAYYSDNNKG